MYNYFNKLSLREKLNQLSKCRLMKKDEFINGINYLKNKKIVIIGCGSQGLYQGLNMRDSGLDISYALRNESILNKKQSWRNATEHRFNIGSYEDMIPYADFVINLTPDKEHSHVIKKIQHLMKYNSTLGYSHGFNIVEIGEIIRKDITVIMVAPKSPGTEVREEYKRCFGVPALIAVHKDNDKNNDGIEFAKAWAVAIGSHRIGVLESSFVAEVKSDLIGEQTILCGLLQSTSIVLFEYLIKNGINKAFATKLIQYGWEKITKALKYGGITLMMDRISCISKIRAYQLSEKIKCIMKPLFQKHADDIMSGKFSYEMIKDWNEDNNQLITWRNEMSNKTEFENAPISIDDLNEQDYFDNGILMIAIIKAGVELAFETMISSGISAESAYYESLHELPLIANTIARKRLYEMNKVISDTAEYGNYLFANTAISLLKKKLIPILLDSDLGSTICKSIKIDNLELDSINHKIQNHPIEKIGKKLRSFMIQGRRVSNS